MPSLNHVDLMGNLTDAPKISYGQGQDAKAVAHFTLAVKRRHSKEDASDFISCTAFGKTAEFIGKHFVKGDAALIEGRIQTGSYTNKDGVKVYTTEVVVDDIDFGENKSQRDARRQNQPQMAPQGMPQQMPQGYPQMAPQGMPQQMPQGYPQQMPQGQPAQQMVPQVPQGQPAPQQAAPQQQMPPQGMPPQGMPPQGGAPFGAPGNWNFQ